MGALPAHTALNRRERLLVRTDEPADQMEGELPPRAGASSSSFGRAPARPSLAAFADIASCRREPAPSLNPPPSRQRSWPIADPHEAQQVAILQRIVRSSERLHSRLERLNSAMVSSRQRRQRAWRVLWPAGHSALKLPLASSNLMRTVSPTFAAGPSGLDAPLGRRARRVEPLHFQGWPCHAGLRQAGPARGQDRHGSGPVWQTSLEARAGSGHSLRYNTLANDGPSCCD